MGSMGLEARRLEAGTEDVGSLEKGVWTIHRELPPWSSQVVYVRMRQP